ncbi:hypothetical protein Lesp02_06010 [Lentzea sp. NBRC 105346]|uniref:hypothetical protein n=1 Tax=Lentzea sp. NBRC 105346 TaxID=3032205 RepID=UPI0024A3AF72|nr:hypothetical protein [Lentzea sp. NBRC 105346]GLZ28411.1 hypothetical protein Lesp02_06010 [Lentzea sp. NBRC 105346]
MIDIADRPDVAPELRLVPHAFRRVFGRPAEGVWYAPGVLELMGGALSVCAKWGAIVAADRRGDGRLELASINRPAERVTLPGGDVPAWASHLRQLDWAGGATLLCSVGLPRGSGLRAGDALRNAVAMALNDLHGTRNAVPASCGGKPGHAVDREGGLRELDLTGQRLLVIDTRIRKDTPVEQRRACVDGDLGDALTAYHFGQRPDPEQDTVVAAALAAGARGASMLVDEPGRPVVALVDKDRLPTVRATISTAYSPAPRYLTVLPSGGAYRVT